jgi:hypothetical protein
MDEAGGGLEHMFDSTLRCRHAFLGPLRRPEKGARRSDAIMM